MKTLLSVILLALLAGLMAAKVLAQRSTGTISGRVITEDGQPIPHAKISILGIGGLPKMMSGRLEILTDERGEFQADRLDAAPYSISAIAPGYVVMAKERGGSVLGAVSSKYVHVGDSVTIRMIRGGVITGRVTNASGEPVVGINIEATRVRDENGRQLTDGLNPVDLAPGRRTDDRGVYRVYGLAPGSYVVSVGGGSLGFSLSPTPFNGRMNIYYPSETRDTATEVAVRGGEEASGIDIRYRSERGFAISGRITGIPAGGQSVALPTGSFVVLTKAGTDTLVTTSMVSPLAENNSYAIYGVPNGEYEVTAVRPILSDSSVMTSVSRRVVLNGRDVAGIDLALVASASISGSIRLEKLAAASGHKCEDNRDSSLEEIVLLANHDDPNPKPALKLSFVLSAGIAVPNDKGGFTIAGLRAGRHFVGTQLPDEDWYVKSVILSSVPAANAAARQASNNGIVVKAGEKVVGLTITVAEGAAGLKGKITTSRDEKLPAGLRVYLIPAEPEAKDDLLRFAEANVDDDSFTFTNLPPGKYLLLARTNPQPKSSEAPVHPLAWDATERTRLRKEAEAANAAVELKPCQRLTDFTLRSKS